MSNTRLLSCTDLVYAAVKKYGPLKSAEVPAAIAALFPDRPQPAHHTVRAYLCRLRQEGRLVSPSHGIVAHPDAVMEIDPELQALLS